MSVSHLIVYNSHNGQSTKVPKPVRFHKLPEFKHFISEQLGISDVENIFILTSFGIKLNFNLINESNDVYVYDKRLFSNDYIPKFTEDNEPSPLPKGPTIAYSHTASIKQQSGNLKVNQAWARALQQDCIVADEKIKQLVKQINIIFKSLNLIFQFCTNFVNEVEKTFGNYLNFIKLVNYKSLTSQWSQNLENLKKFPVIKIDNSTINLVTYLSTDQLEVAANFVSLNLPLVVQKFNSMNESFTQINNEKLDIDKSIEKLRNESITSFKNLSGNKIISEMSVIINQINTDLDKVSESVNLSTIYKTHLSELSPDLYDKAKSLFNYLSDLKKFQTKLHGDSVKVFKSVANLQMKIVNIKSDLKTLTATDPQHPTTEPNFETINKIKKYEDYLSLTIDLPLLFGFMLIEKRRQTEWFDFYSKGIVNNVSEQLTSIIDHEKLFRKIWLKKFGNFLTLLGDDTPHVPVITLPNIDISIIGKNADNFNILHKLSIQREDVINYISLLDTYPHGSKNFVQLLNKNFKDLTKSTNNLKKITKLVSSLSTFTSNSVSPAESKIISSEDAEDDFDLNLIRDLKLRIKKLENLLHQQQYKNLNTWPVVSNASHSQGADGKMSMIFSSQQQSQQSHHTLGSPQFVSASKFGGSMISSTPKFAKRLSIGNTPSPVSPPRTNPTSLLQKKPPLTNQRTNESQILDSSVIDKHLDNIRLKKEIQEVSRENKILDDDNRSIVSENKQLRSRNDQLSEENRALVAEQGAHSKLIDELKKEIHSLKNQQSLDRIDFEHSLNSASVEHNNSIKKLEDEYESKLSSGLKDYEARIEESEKQLAAKDEEFHTFKINTSKSARDVENLTYKLNQRDNQITELQGHIAKFTELNTNSSQEVFHLNGTIKTLREDLNDAVKMSNDLLSNLSSKELEFSNERKSLEGDIKNLQTKVDEITEDYENLMELTQNSKKNDSVIQELNSTVAGLLKDINRLIDNNFEYFLEFCFVLESMGLLLVNENDEYKISRVKGLRNKKSAEDPNETVILTIEKPSSKVIEMVESSKQWTSEVADSLEPATLNDESHPLTETTSSANIDDEKISEESGKLISIYNNYFKSGDSKFEEFLNAVSFKENIQLREDEATTTTKFFLSAISKRFRDVEGFAKRQTKENKTKQQEIQRLTSRVNSKISMNGFQENDLVLFLPTSIDREHEVSETFQPWAAFNIGAPHYFLNISHNHEKFVGKYWMVGRVGKITEWVVTSENVDDHEANPFQLSVGVVWYMVEAKEEPL